MKTKEFIRRFEESGYLVTTNGSEIIIEIEDGITIAVVSDTIMGLADTNFHGAEERSEHERLAIVKTIFEYALTPLECREEPERYYARHKKLGRKSDCINLDKRNGELILDSTLESMFFETIFTKQELIDLLGEEELKRNYALEEVEDDN